MGKLKKCQGCVCVYWFLIVFVSLRWCSKRGPKGRFGECECHDVFCVKGWGSGVQWLAIPINLKRSRKMMWIFNDIYVFLWMLIRGHEYRKLWGVLTRDISGSRSKVYLELQRSSQFFAGCFSWMIPNLYRGMAVSKKHPLKTGCLGFRV